MGKKKRETDELEELDQAYAEITGYRPGQKKRSPWAVALVIVLTVVLALCGAFLLLANHSTLFDGFLKMRPLTMGGVDLTGMTKEEAKQQLAAAAERLTAEDMVIHVLEETVVLSPADTQITPRTDEAVDDAFREGFTGTFDWIPYLGLNTDAVRSAVDALGSKYNTDLSQTTAIVSGEMPSLLPDADASEEGLTLTVTIGSPEYGLDTEALYAQVLAAYNSCDLEVVGTCSQLEPERPDLEAIYYYYYVAPVDAAMDPKTFEISTDTHGYHFDLEAATEAVANAPYGQVLEFPFTKIAPKVTAAFLASGLFCDVLGSAETPYSGSDDNNRNTNIAVACAAINGLVLLPGETFSYNNTLGERTEEAGYKPAPSYVDGLTVDTLGGGICQVSSTLYYSTLFADLKINERYNHGYVSDYIPKGMDATVSWGGADLKFTNNTNFPIRIEAWRVEGKVHVQILGTEERDYYIKMTYRVRETIPYDTIYEEYPSDNPKRYRDGQTIVTPYTGYVVQTYKQKYSRETDELISSEFWTHDTYKKRDKVICRIVDTPSTEATGATE